MKKLFLLSIIFVAINQCNAQNMTGNWHWQSGNGKNMFDLTLKRIDTNTIKGYHCAVFHNGNKIDCMPNDKNYSVSFTKKETNIFQGTIFSTYGAVKVNYKLTYNPSNDTILLERLKNPNADVFIPKKVILNRN